MQRGAPKIEPPRARPLHAIAPDAGAVRAAQRVVTDLFGPTSAREFAVRYWDGTTEHPARRPTFSLDIRHPAALRRMLLPPTELSIAEAYIRGDIDVGGDIERAANLGDVVM